MSFYKIPFGAQVAYQFALVPAGQTVVLYRFGNWGFDFRAFIERIGLGPYCLPWGPDGIQFMWEIDGETVEVFNYQIAEIKNPKQFFDYYVAKVEIIWRVVNNSDDDHYCEVLCDGMLVMTPSARRKYRV